jgi:hypothetical protein
MRPALPLLTALSLLCLAAPICAQEPPHALSASIAAEDEARRALNRQGMTILMGWALANMAVGGAAMWRTSGRWRGFHEMNAGWSLVNMTIGAFGYWGNRGPMPGQPSLWLTIAEDASIREVLLLNAGLDVGYMALGGLLWERGLRTDSARMVGWGHSVLLQGAFLFVFDLTLYGLHRGRSADWMLELQQLAPGVMGPGFSATF